MKMVCIYLADRIICLQGFLFPKILSGLIIRFNIEVGACIVEGSGFMETWDIMKGMNILKRMITSHSW
jgi:hypothetical protein